MAVFSIQETIQLSRVAQSTPSSYFSPIVRSGGRRRFIMSIWDALDRYTEGGTVRLNSTFAEVCLRTVKAELLDLDPYERNAK